VALVEAHIDSHVVHLGTVGVYGYGTAGVKIPEAYLRVRIDGDDGGEVAQEILYPDTPAIGYPLTVHGTGCGAFSSRSRLRPRLETGFVCFNHQMTECDRVIDLAELISSLTGAEVDLVDNPRKEAAENELP
jgi:hypothetical protein